MKISKEKYCIVSIPSKQIERFDLVNLSKNFYSFIYDTNNITLIINQKNWKEIEKNFALYKIEKSFRILTPDAELSWDVVGFIANLTKILAENKISVGVISSFSKDHLLIRNKDVRKARKVLKNEI
ncbi:MAG: ACT domain-containing protein [Nanoarchaeota archaeon]